MYSVEYIDCISAVELDLPSTSVLDMTLSYLIVKLQSCSFGCLSFMAYQPF